MDFYLKVNVKKKFDIKYFKIDAGVRYWEDADVNGEPDVDLIDGDPNATPRMPFAEKDENGEWRWRPLIDIETGKIVNWPEGTKANIHYKVCDDGNYTLLDSEMNELIYTESYVPSVIGEYGDYIVMDILPDGTIEYFSFEITDLEDIVEGAFNEDVYRNV